MQSFIQKNNISDSPISYNNKIPNNTFHQYCKGVFSKSGEEGIIDKILQDLSLSQISLSNWFCDAYARNGIEYSNTHFLAKRGYKGLCIEKDKNKFDSLLETYKGNSNILLVNTSIDENNSIDSLLSKVGAPIDLDLLSIDLDHLDYFAWESCINYRPKIVVIEYNPYRDPICEQLPGDKDPKPNLEQDALFYLPYSGQIGNGASFHSMIKLGLKKAYIPIACTGNLIFVRRDLINRVTIPHIVSNSSIDYLYLFPSFYFYTTEQRWLTNTYLQYCSYVRDLFLGAKLSTRCEANNYTIDLNRIDLMFNPISSPFITTYWEKCDGGGSTVQRYVSAFAIAKRINVPYKHIKQTIFEHNRGDMDDDTWSNRWHNLFPFEVQSELTFSNVINDADLETIKTLSEKGLNIHYPKRVIDNDISILQDAVSDLKNIYDSNPNLPILSYDPKRINIAIHVRNFTSTDCCLAEVRKYLHTEDGKSYYHKAISYLKSIIKLPITINIFSEGEDNIFEQFTKYRDSTTEVIIRNKENALTSFHHMVKADILVTAVSSLSYLAHIICDGIVISHPEQIHTMLTTTIQTDFQTSHISPNIEIDIIRKTLSIYQNRLCELVNPPIKCSLSSISLYKHYPQFLGWYNDPTVEKENKQWWINNSKSDWIVLDVGANIGLFSAIIGSKVKKVYAIEPFIKTIQMLRYNLYMNNIHNVEILPFAVGEKEETKQDRIYREWGTEPELTTFNFTTIDRIIDNKNIKVNAIKIDVDSFDYEVLLGARATLVNYKPYVIVELNHALSKRNHTIEEAVRYMESISYKLVKIMDNGENWFFESNENSRIETLSLILNSLIPTCKGFGPLAKDIHNAIEWDRIIRTYNIDTWVETGTYLGETTEYMAITYPNMKIITCELDRNNYEQSKNKLSKYPNVTIFCESSELTLNKKELYENRNVFYFLDAHWNDYWPILDELKAINSGIVCIHDFDIKNEKFGYDVYKGEIKLDTDYIRSVVTESIYSNNPNADYNIQTLQNEPRGRAYICYEKKNWLSKIDLFQKLS